MILADDLGYTDLGVYGSKISTPTIDALATEGAQFTNFHTNPLCAPTRAALMTGQDPHRVGLGSMEGLIAPGVTTEVPGYKGSLEGEYTGIAQILADVDYATYQVGKWHLGMGPGQTPQALGFEQNFTMYQGGASHYSDALRLTPGRQEPVDTAAYERNGQPVSELSDSFYSTDAYTDELLNMIDSGNDDRPFFGYLAYTAPHDPLHVPDTGLVEKYLDTYLDANDFTQLRADRISDMADLGLIEPDVATRWPSQTPEWNALSPEQHRDLAYRLAVYSAMIEHMDSQIGRVVDRLKDSGEYDNTLIVVASDNGASGLSPDIYTQSPGAREWLDKNYPLIGDVASYGKPGSFPVLSLPNAQVSSGPYFHSKGTVFEGGTRAPMIVKTPGAAGEQDGPRIVDTLAYIGDLYPTFADYAGAALVEPEVLIGSSAKQLLDGSSDDIGDEMLGLELFGERAFRDGNSKLVFAAPGNNGTGGYALYNLADDPGETVDLSSSEPDEVERLSELWDKYAADNNVIPADFAAVNAAEEWAAEVSYSMDWSD